jgi:hypothetical protein
VFLADTNGPEGDSDEVEGTIVDFSDSGEAARVFAVIEVIQRQTVVVPSAKLKSRREPNGN